MIRLVLIRHAKSDWGAPALADHDRPLNDRGRRDAPRMAARLADTGIRPDIVLSSTALRALTTARVFAEKFGIDPQQQSRLYGADARTLLRAAEEAGALLALDGATVAIVAHDPGLSELAEQLSSRIAHMPTCAVATFTWDDDDWGVIGAVEPASFTFDAPR